MSETLEKLERERLAVVIRGTYGDDLVRLVDALRRGGLSIFELTFDPSADDPTRAGLESIDLLRGKFGDEVTLGAGTVLTAEQAAAAADGGASFIVAPNTNPEVITRTKELGLVSIPGAITPTEVLWAHDLGADMVKLFPAGTMGVKYAKDLLAPISNVKFMATAGLTPDVLRGFFEIGFTAAGISSYVTNKKLIAAGDFDTLEANAREMVGIARSFGE